MKSAIRDTDPVYLMESESSCGLSSIVSEEEYLIPIGKAAAK